MSAPIPLASPAGVVYGWACGVCHRHAPGGERLRLRGGTAPAGPDPETAERSRERAEMCCTCRTCGAVELGAAGECIECAAERKARWEAERPAREEKERRQAAVAGEALATSQDESAALQLLAELRDLSEMLTCCGWNASTIAGLRDLVLSGVGDRDDVPIVRLRALREQAGGWWRWSEEADDPVFYRDGATP